MKKEKIAIILIIGATLLLGLWLFLSRKSSPQADQQPAMKNEDQSRESNGGMSAKESLLALLEGTSGVKCSITDANGSYTVIAQGEKAKVEGIDFAGFQSPGTEPQKGTMVNDGEWAYIWSGSEGLKFNLKEMQPQDSSSANQEYAADWKEWAKNAEEKGAEYDCSPTVATSSDFIPPSDVKFQDLGELTKNVQRQIQSNPDIPANLDLNQLMVPQE